MKALQTLFWLAMAALLYFAVCEGVSNALRELVRASLRN
jgi:hypothetical protein